MPTDHVTIKLPKELVDEMDELDKTHGFRGRGEIAKQAVREFLAKYGMEPHQTLPRFEQINSDENGVKILDRQLRKVVDVHFKPNGITCTYDESSDCEHISFALAQKDIQAIIRKKKREGWKLPNV